MSSNGKEPGPVPRLKERYQTEIVPAMVTEFGYKNVMQVPRLSKIAVNIGLGEALQNGRAIEAATTDLGIMTGQKPVVTKARQSIATYKLREGMPVGVKVTMRRIRMFEFLDRLICIALPRVRDFRGINPAAFDGRGNYTLGVRDILIFPEIDYQKVEGTTGMNITISTSAPTDDQARALLAGLGMPFYRR